MKKEPTIQDVLDAVQVFSTAVDKRFVEFKNELKKDLHDVRAELKGDIQGVRTELKGDIALLRADVGILNHKLDRMDVRVNRLETV